MMWNSDGSWGHGWFWPGAVFMAAFMVFCLWMMVRMMSHGSHRPHGYETREQHDPRSEDAERILAERLARGEIDVQEYERRLAVLRQSSHAGTT